MTINLAQVLYFKTRENGKASVIFTGTTLSVADSLDELNARAACMPTQEDAQPEEPQPDKAQPGPVKDGKADGTPAGKSK